MHIASHNIKCINEKYMEMLSPYGLKGLIYPISGAVQSCVSLAVNFGSFDTRIEGRSGMMTLPWGMAHFVEHYKFQNTQKNSASLFSATGAHANALTAYDRTVFFFKGHDNINDSLNILLERILAHDDVVNMQSIKDVICEEIILYSNDPVEKGRLLLMQELFPRHPVSVDIAGTEKLVQSVDQETVNSVLKSIYVPENMVLSMAGNVSGFEADALSADLPYINSATSRAIPKALLEIPNPPILRDKVIRLSLGMYTPGFLIGVRPRMTDLLPMAQKVLDEIFFDLIVGPASDLQLSWLKQGELGEELAIEVDYARDIGYTILTGVSKRSDKIFTDIKEKIHRVGTNGIPEKAFAKSRMAVWGKYVTYLDDGFEICNFLTSSFIYNSSVEDILGFISALTFEELNACQRQ